MNKLKFLVRFSYYGDLVVAYPLASWQDMKKAGKIFFWMMEDTLFSRDFWKEEIEKWRNIASLIQEALKEKRN
jgi:hypothetical protein